MSGTIFVSLILNAALLLVLALVYDLLARHLDRYALAFKLLTGLVLGVISIALMAQAFELSGGIIFDTRSVVLSMGTLFYGTLPGAIAGVIAAVFRAGQGGSGAVMGVSVILMSVVVGALWRRRRRIARRDPSVLELYLFGLTVHGLMLVLTSTLPDPLATLREIALPVIIVYPLASVLLGLLMIDARRRLENEQALRLHAEQLQRTLQGAIVVLGRMLEARDPYTGGHQRRVGELVAAMAERMGFSEAQTADLRLEAEIHDLGQIAVPAEILTKPGRLTDTEFLLIKEHPVAGHAILSGIDFHAPLADVVLQHHERLDGSGNPNGLRGEEIRIEARVLAVADVYEAMVSHRPYRGALSHEEAAAELRGGAGVLYDRHAVSACLELIEGGFEFSSPAA